jgi:predicted nuclease with TOPRIM domain
MKTIEAVKKEEEEIRKKLEESVNEKAELNGRLLMLKQARLYLETEPNHDVVCGMRTEVMVKIESIENGFGAWMECKKGNFSGLKRKYLSERGIGTLKEQKKMLNFILR